MATKKTTKRTTRKTTRKNVLGGDLATGTKKPTGKATKKSATKTPTKKLSLLDAAHQILTQASEPMTTKQIVEAAANKNLWTSPGGKTPHNTLYAALLREINTKGEDSRFTKADRGLFTTTSK